MDLPNSPEKEDAEGSMAKSPKTVTFSEQVEMRHVDADDGSILSVETRSLAESDNDETSLDKFARDIDKNLFFLDNTNLHNLSVVLTSSGSRAWDPSRLSNLLRHYQSSGAAELMGQVSLRTRRRTSSVLIALSQIMNKIEDMEEERQQQQGGNGEARLIPRGSGSKYLARMRISIEKALLKGVLASTIEAVVNDALKTTAVSGPSDQNNNDIPKAEDENRGGSGRYNLRPRK